VAGRRLLEQGFGHVDKGFEGCRRPGRHPPAAGPGFGGAKSTRLIICRADERLQPGFCPACSDDFDTPYRPRGPCRAEKGLRGCRRAPRGAPQTPRGAPHAPGRTLPAGRRTGRRAGEYAYRVGKYARPAGVYTC
jgi:hypothetical protein